MKIYWQERLGPPSLGDELTALALQRMYGLVCERHPLTTADLVSRGSILDRVWESWETTQSFEKNLYFQPG